MKYTVFTVHAIKAYRGNRRIAPLTLNLDTKSRWVTTHRPRYPRERTLVPTELEARLAPQQVCTIWKREKFTAPDGIRNTDYPVHGLATLLIILPRLVHLSFRSCDSCRRLPEPKHHSFLFNHWSATKCLVFMAARTPSIHAIWFSVP